MRAGIGREGCRFNLHPWRAAECRRGRYLRGLCGDRTLDLPRSGIAPTTDELGGDQPGSRHGAGNTMPGLMTFDGASIVANDHSPLHEGDISFKAIVTRDEAWLAKLPRYFLGLEHPCRRGHISERHTKNGSCVSCRTENLRAQRRACGVKERVLLTAEESKRRESLRRKIWRESNEDLMAIYDRKRRAKRRGAAGNHTAKELSNLFEKQKGLCANCRKSLKTSYHVDHVLPLALGGSHWITNIQLLCPPCNQRKGAKHPIDFARLEGRLV